MKKKINVFFLFFIVSVLLPLTGCESNMDFLMNGEEQDATAVSTDIFIPVEKIRTLNPIVSKDEDTYYIDKLIYEGLFALNDKLQAEPILVKSFSYEDDGYSIILYLKQDVRWHDGEEFTASDVKFSIDCYLNVFYSNLSIYNDYVKNIKSTKVQDQNTIQIYFKTNTDVALEKLTFPIVPKHQFKSVSAIRQSEENFIPIGTGPYKVASVDTNKEIILEANYNYHGKKAQNRVCFRVLPDRLDAVNLFDINDLTLSFSKNIDRDTLLNNKEVQMVSFPSNEVELIGFNYLRTATSNPLVRKALSYTMDIDEILETAYYNSGIRSDNLYYPGFMGTDSREYLREPDVDQAKKLLEEAGYIDRDGNGFIENERNEEITIEILVNNEDASRLAAAQIVRDGLVKLPIHVFVTQVDWGSYCAKLAAKQYDLYIGGYRIQDNFDLRFLLHSDYGNPIGYSNLYLDSLLDSMESGFTGEEKRTAYQKVKRILEDETPYYCMFYKTYGLIGSKGLTGNLKPYFYHPYNGCEDWTVMYKIPEETTK